jgi:hypothetical protein
MIPFLENLHLVNKPLFFLGLVSLFGAMVCMALMQFTQTEVLGVNAWLKPFKFYFSVVFYAWTMAWMLQFLPDQLPVPWYSWALIIGLGYELFVITWQASLGKMSHFNTSTAFDAALWTSMGVVITIVTLWTGFMGIQFFTQSTIQIPDTWLWGIRLGILFTVIFSFEGAAMGSMMRHTVGAADGGAGLPIVNWSTKHGDLRIAHFLGIHALQVVPLFAVMVARSVQQVWWFALVYFLLVSITFIQAMMGRPLIAWK